ncbi:MAG: zinc-ribbon domain-containing protein [Aeromonadaceae bacterium]
MVQQVGVGYSFSTASGSVVSVVGMAEKGKHGQERCLLVCSKCHQDAELFPEPLARDVGQVRLGRVPCGCAPSPRWDEKQLPIVVRRLVDGWAELVEVKEFAGNQTRFTLRCLEDGGEWETDLRQIKKVKCPFCAHGRWTEQKARKFVEADGRYIFKGFQEGRRAAVYLECPHDGHVWMATMRNFKGAGTGCPKCAGTAPLTSEEVERRVRLRDDVEIAEPVGEVTGASKIKLRCKKDGWVWECRVSHAIQGDTGCPCCSRPGFDPNMPGILYVVKWEKPCGGSFIKFGISNSQLDKRLKSQAKESGYKPTSVATFDFQYGVDAENCERLLMMHQKREWGRGATKAEFADGYTETAPAHFHGEVLAVVSEFVTSGI